MSNRVMAIAMAWFLPCLLLAWAVAEGATFVANPFHVPALQLPLRLFGLQLFKGNDITMAPTVAGDHYVLVTAWPYRHGDPEVGDIVVMQYPEGSEQLLLRRIVAKGPGKVELEGGALFVDGQRRQEPWVDADHASSPRARSMRARPLPDGCYFVMGDNRDISQDSREWGCVHRAAILGRLW